MTDTARIDQMEISVGGLSRSTLLSSLSARGILLNAHAETLIDDDAFDSAIPRQVMVTERSVTDLGLVDGATLPQILEAARQQGLLPCPVDAAPYLRMAWNEQDTSPDSVMSTGRAPTGALTVATERLSDDDEYPRGFYLRVVDGDAWLRGYRCDDEHLWSPGDRFIFQQPADTPFDD
jgi:hypothetical protein